MRPVHNIGPRGPRVGYGAPTGVVRGGYRGGGSYGPQLGLVGGASFPTFTVTGLLIGIGFLSGLIDAPVLTPSGDIVGIGVMSGTIAAPVLTPSGDIVGVGELGSYRMLPAGHETFAAGRDTFNVTTDELLADGSMGYVDAGMWTAGSSATLTKETGTRTGGNNTRVLRVAYNAVNYPRAQNAALTSGETYRVRGWYRGDGSKYPRAKIGAKNVDGTVSAEWQYFDFVDIATTPTLRLYAMATSAGWCEFADVSVSQGAYWPDPINFSAAGWLKTGVVVSGSVADPDGGTDAYLLTEATDGAPTTHHIRDIPLGAVSGKPAKYTIAAKADGRSHLQVVNFNGTNHGAYFDLVNGTVSSLIGTGATASIVDLGGGWFDCSVWFDAYNVAGTSTVNYPAASDGGSTYQGDGRAAITIYNARIEQALVTVVNDSSRVNDQLVVDGSMEAVGVADWNIVTGVATKVAGSPGGGGSQVLRLTNAAWGAVGQSSRLTAGRRYRARGWARTDGVTTAKLYDGVGVHWTTTSATWVPFDVVFDAQASGLLFSKATAGTWFELDNFTCYEVNDADQQTEAERPVYFEDAGDGLPALRFTDANNENLSTGLYSQTEGTLWIWAKGSDLATRWLMGANDGTNRAWLRWHAGAISARVGSTAASVAAVSVVADRWYFLAMTWSGTTLTIYVDDVAEPFAIAAAAGATTDDAYVGTLNNTGTPDPTAFDGWIRDWGVCDVALTAAQLARIRLDSMQLDPDESIKLTPSGNLTGIGMLNGIAAADVAGCSGHWNFKDVATRTELGSGLDVALDGNMEAVGTTDWTALYGAALSKQTGSPYSGVQVLRVTYGGTNNPSAANNGPTVIGRTYRATGWARSDGSGVPRFQDGFTSMWTGTTSTDWQEFDVTYVAVATGCRLNCQTSGAAFAEFDQVKVVEERRLTQLDDDSGLGRDMVEESDLGGIVTDHAIGLHSAPVFNGVDEMLHADAVADDVTGLDEPVTVITQFRWISNVADARLWSFGRVASGTPFFAPDGDGGTDTALLRKDNTGANVDLAGTAGAGTDPSTYSVVFYGNTVSTYWDGVQEHDGIAMAVGTMTVDRYAWACLLRAAASLFSNVAIGEQSVHARALGDEERELLEGIFANHWAEPAITWTPTGAMVGVGALAGTTTITLTPSGDCVDGA